MLDLAARGGGEGGLAGGLPYLEAQIQMAALLQQGGANPVVRLAVGVINLPGHPEMVQGLVPIAVSPLQYATVQPHLPTVHTHLHLAETECDMLLPASQQQTTKHHVWPSMAAMSGLLHHQIVDDTAAPPPSIAERFDVQ